MFFDCKSFNLRLVQLGCREYGGEALNANLCQVFACAVTEHAANGKSAREEGVFILYLGKSPSEPNDHPKGNGNESNQVEVDVCENSKNNQNVKNVTC